MKLKSLLVVSLLAVTSLTAVENAVAASVAPPAPPPPAPLTQAQTDAKKKAADASAAKMRAGAANTAGRVQHNTQQRNNWAQNRLRGKNGIIQDQQNTIGEQNKLIAQQEQQLAQISSNVQKIIAYFEKKAQEAKAQSGGNADAEKVALKQAVDQQKQASTTAVKQAATEVNKAIETAKTTGDTTKVEEAKKNLANAVGQNAAVTKVAETVAKTATTPNANPANDLKKEDVKVAVTKAATDAATKASENVDKKAAEQGVPVASTLPGAKEAIPGLNVTPQQLQDAKAGLKSVVKDGKPDAQGAAVPPPPPLPVAGDKAPVAGDKAPSGPLTDKQLQDAKAGLKSVVKDGKPDAQGAAVPPPPPLPPVAGDKAPVASGPVTAEDLKLQQKLITMTPEQKAKLKDNLEKALGKVKTDLAAPNLDPKKKSKLERGQKSLEAKLKSLDAAIKGGAAGSALGDKKANEAPNGDVAAHTDNHPAENKAEGSKEPGEVAPNGDVAAHTDNHPAENKAEGAKEPGEVAPNVDVAAHTDNHPAENKAEGAKEPGEAPKAEALKAVNEVADKVEEQAKVVEDKAHEVEAKEAEAKEKAAAGDQKGAADAKSEADHAKEELKQHVEELKDLKDQHDGAIAAVTEAAKSEAHSENHPAMNAGEPHAAPGSEPKAEGVAPHSDDHPAMNAGEPHAAPGSEPKAEGATPHSDTHPKVSAEEKAKVDEKKTDAVHKEEAAKAKEAEVQNAVASGAGNDEVAKLQAELKAMRDAQEAAKIAAEKAQNEAEKKALNDKIKDLEDQVGDLVKAAKAAGAKIVYELGEDGKKHMSFVIEEKKPTEPKPAEPSKSAETEVKTKIENLSGDDISTPKGAKDLKDDLNSVKDPKEKKEVQEELVSKAVELITSGETNRVLNNVPGVGKIKTELANAGIATHEYKNPVTGMSMGIEVGAEEKKPEAPAPVAAAAPSGRDKA